MIDRDLYTPGPASGARVQRDGAPFDADASLGQAGATVKLTRADAPKLLEYVGPTR